MKRLQLVGLGLAALVTLTLLGSLLRGLDGDSDGSTQSGEADREAAKRVRVEVLNAAGIPGLARAATEQLRERGFDVVFYGNATGQAPDTSLVLDRVGATGNAERVAEALGIERTRTEVDSTLFVDVSVVIGRDWVSAAEAGDTVVGR